MRADDNLIARADWLQSGQDDPHSGTIRELIAALRASQEREHELREALEPFDTVGKLIDSGFGPGSSAKDSGTFQSGAAWTQNGEKRTLTWGDFRRARAALQKHNAVRGQK